MNQEIEQLIETALREDLNDRGDVTTNSLIPSRAEREAIIVARQAGVIAGIDIASQVFHKIDTGIETDFLVADGKNVQSGDRIMKIRGKTTSILTAERTALNFLQRLSGIATLTARFVEQVNGTRAKILDTRKTTPGLRDLEKYAVRVGRGLNHRFGLYDMVLIKENHIAAAGGITGAIQQVKKHLTEKRLEVKIEVETRTLEEVREALDSSVDRIMLDNMSVPQIKEAVALVAGKAELEVSGGVTLDTVRPIAEIGVDYISVGALTHSAKAFDLSLLIKELATQ